jgi:hypothetical protein
LTELPLHLSKRQFSDASLTGLEYFQPEGVFSWRRWLPATLLLPTGK